MTLIANRIKSIPLTSLDVSTLSGTFLPINVGGLPKACFYIKLVNSSTKDLLISYDGAVSHDIIFSSTETFNNVIGVHCQPSQSNNGGAVFPAGQVIYAAASTGGTGLIYLIGYYQG